MELREAALELQEENIQLREEISKLKATLNKKVQMTYQAPFYWKKTDEGQDGPYCQKCFDESGNSIRLQDQGNDSWTCLSCSKWYTGPNHKEVDINDLDYSSSNRFGGFI
ncbi:hypothetical protein FNO25_001976 [Vibrio fluvialis]|uniref:hypothetical protein n=1 Tax=Vibrio fluvialis TaxID=676 RepID=UPI003D7D8352|nr:hypothetical protein [Vibrio fluvialis]